MTVIGNILWILLGGFIISLLYFLGGLLFCLTIVGIPFGWQCIKLAGLALLPFGKDVSPSPWPASLLSVGLNVLWIIFFGLEIALIHLLLAVLLSLSIIGIPFAKQHIKLLSLCLVPFGQNAQSASKRGSA